MPNYTGYAIARTCLRRIGLIDPTEPGDPEQLDHALELATDMLDEWRTHKLTISGMTRTVYGLASGTQSYTIGPGGDFDQAYPNAIEKWSVVPDRGDQDPIEMPRGRPVTHVEWQRIRVKSVRASYPHTLYFDQTFQAGLGGCHFYPMPDTNTVDVVLYQKVPDLTELEANTTYTLKPGAARAIKLNLAIELAEALGVEAPPGLEMRARQALGSLKRSNKIVRESPTRGEFAIGGRRKTFNIYTDQ